MIIGESIIIFMVINMLVIIRLIIRKGINRRKLIWNVVFNLLVINVGIMMVMGIFFKEW